MAITLLDPYTRSVIFEKFIVPDWFEKKFSTYFAQTGGGGDCKKAYRIFLRLVHGDDLTVTGFEAFINKCSNDWEKIDRNWALYFIDYLGIVGIDSGSFDFNETHYNIYASKQVKYTT